MNHIERLAAQVGMKPQDFLIVAVRNFPTLRELTPALGLSPKSHAWVRSVLNRYGIQPAQPGLSAAWIIKKGSKR